MVLSAELRAKRKAFNEQWREMFKSEHGRFPDLDVSSHGDCMGEREDLNSKWLADDDEAGKNKERKVLLMQIMTDGDGINPGFVSDGGLQDPTTYEVFVHLERLGKPLGYDHYIETYMYTAEDDGHDGSIYTWRGVALMMERCWQEKEDLVKDTFTDQLILDAVAWAVEWADESSGYELHAVIAFCPSKAAAEARAAVIKTDDPDVVRYGDRQDFSDGVRRVKPYELRGNRRVKPQEVWACLLSATALSDVVHAVFDTKEAAQAYWEEREGCKFPDLSNGMVVVPDGENCIKIRRFPF